MKRRIRENLSARPTSWRRCWAGFWSKTKGLRSGRAGRGISLSLSLEPPHHAPTDAPKRRRARWYDKGDAPQKCRMRTALDSGQIKEHHYFHYPCWIGFLDWLDVYPLALEWALFHAFYVIAVPGRLVAKLPRLFPLTVRRLSIPRRRSVFSVSRSFYLQQIGYLSMYIYSRNRAI